MITSSTPAITVHMNRPSTPWTATIRHDDNKCAGGAADLGLRSAERGDQKTSDDGAVDSGLRCEAGCDGKCHGQRQCDQTHSDAGDKVQQKFLPVIGSETEYGLRKPIVAQENTRHFHIIALNGGIG